MRTRHALPALATGLALHTLTACGGGSGGGAALPVVDLSPARVTEGDSGTADLEFVVRMNAAASTDVTMDYATSALTASPGSDYVQSSGPLTIPAGQVQATFVVPVRGDVQLEPDETLNASIANLSGNALPGITQALGTIVDDDLPRLDISSESVLEGDGGTSDLRFTVSLEAPAASDVSFEWATADGSASDGSDYTGSGGPRPLTIPAGGTAAAIDVPVLGDSDPEADETFTVTLSNVTGPARTGTTVGTGTILDDDTPPPSPRVSVGAEATFEGDAGSTTDLSFAVIVDPPAPGTVTLSYATADDTAVEPGDYLAASGTVTVPAGSAGETFTVTVNGDDDPEDFESFVVALELLSGSAMLVAPRTRGYILDDDGAGGAPRVSVGDAEVFEGDGGTTTLSFDVVLSEPAGSPVTFSYATADDTALAGSDYEARSGDLTLDPGVTLTTLEVTIFGDSVIEADERFRLDLANLTGGGAVFGDAVAFGTILTDDPLALVSIADAGIAEGDAGTADLSFTVTLSVAAEDDVAVGYFTGDPSDTATAGEDYVATSGTLVIPAGARQGTLRVPVNGDPDAENDEVFTVVLTNPSANAQIGDGMAKGTIVNDDSAGGWRGAELLHDGTPEGMPIASAPQAAFGPGGEIRAVWTQRGGGSSEIASKISTAPGLWGDRELVASTHQAPKLFVDDAGNALAVWLDDIGRGVGEAYSNVYTAGVGWNATAEPIAPAVGVSSAYGIQLAGNPSSGEAVVVWVEPAGPGNDDFNSIWAGHYVRGTGWVNTGPVEAADGHASAPQVAMDAGGNALAVFLQPPATGGFTDLVAYSYDGIGWTGPVVLDGDDTWHAGGVSPPRLDMDAAGNAAVVFVQGRFPDDRVWINRYDVASGWSGPRQADGNPVFRTSEPDVALDGVGNVFVVYLQDGVAAESLWGNRFDVAANDWDGPELLESDDTVRFGAIYYAQIAADDLGNAIAVWRQDDGALRNVRTNRYSFASRSWVTEELIEEIDTGHAGAPALTLDRATGRAIVVWDQGRPDPVFGELFPLSDIWANRFTPP